MNENYLNEGEKLALEAFVANKLMFHAVKKVLLSAVYHQGTLVAGEPAESLRNWAVGITLNQKTDLQGKPRDDPQEYEKIGQRVFAIVEGLNYIEGGFKEIEKYKTIPENIRIEKGNEAR